MSRNANHSATRQHILQAALKSFADCGYAATSVQEIVDAAQVSKPALYYYFKDKADLFQALVDRAHDERYELMQDAAARGRTVAEKLEEMVAAVFEFSLRNRELMRLAFATAFAATREAPGQLKVGGFQRATELLPVPLQTCLVCPNLGGIAQRSEQAAHN